MSPVFRIRMRSPIGATTLPLLCALLSACSSATSDTTVPAPADDGGDNGSSSGGGSGGSSGGSGGSSGSSSGGSGSSSGFAPDAAPVILPDGGTCQTDLSATLGVHVKLSVTWAGTPTVLQPSSGPQNVDIYLLETGTNDGTGKLTGTGRACGVTLPDVQLVLSGGATSPPKLHLEFPDIWDKSTMPTFPVTGTQTSRGPGGQLKYDSVVALLGLNPSGSTSTYANPSTPWPPPNGAGTQPGAYPQFTSGISDDDGDGNPGITLHSTTPSGYQFIPTSIDFAHTGANSVYLVSRNEIQLSGTVGPDCKSGSGTAVVKLFENHILGCVDDPSAQYKNCGNTSGIVTGPGFIDANRPVYIPGTATFTSTQLPAGATCADVRAALP